jgi:ATP-dependent Zn protease
MSEFKLKIAYLGKKKQIFFKDKAPREYYCFSVINSEIIPDKCFYSVKDKKTCQILILDELIKELEIHFDSLSKKIENYQFITVFQENKSAKFNVKNRNWMVLKTKNYLENTIEKIGFWDDNDYFYETVKKTKNSYKNDVQLERKINWGRISFFCLPIIIFFFVFLILKLAVKNI